ncbi:MAG TPA: hypothetical protein VHS81_02990, partial [Caulobacteraceae bacterium]|nr:hypothetical protein [Caulobacteraceae bacterium]
MRSSLGRSLAFAAALLIAAPASAAISAEAPTAQASAAITAEVPTAAASPSPEALRLGVEVAHRMFGHVDWEAQLKRHGGLDSIGAHFDQLKARPQWGEFARQAMTEEFAAGVPEMDEAVGRVFARHFTLDELRAGAELLRGPAGDALAQATADATAGRPIAPASGAAQAALHAAAARPASAAFVQKIGHLDEVMPEADQTVGAAVALGWISRFYAKAAAAEAPLTAARDEKERLAGQLTELMFRSVDFGSLMQRKLGPELEQSFSFSPGWADLMRAAVAEEFGSDRDQLERAGGKVFARYFTLEELKAGVDVLSGPDGAVFAQAVASGASGGGAPPSKDALNRATMALQRTPAGL